MTRRAQRYRDTTLPFRYRDGGIDFAIEAYSLDGRKPRDVELRPGERTINIAPSHVGDEKGGTNVDRWDTASLFGHVGLPESVIEAVFPAGERDKPPAKLYVAVRCHETIYRDRVEVAAESVEAGSFDLRIKLRWEDVRGLVELRPYLVRTTETSDESEYATSANVRVASGDRYEIVVDTWDQDEPSAIDGEEASFSQSEHLPDADQLYYLDFRNESSPKLWLNSDNPRITDVLQTGGSVGAEPRFRDVILDQISYAVWNQLLVRTIAAIDDDGSVKYQWQQNVLDSFARELAGVDDVEDAAHILRNDATDPGGFARLVGRIDRELQEYIEPRRQLINLMEEGLQL